MNKEKAYGKWLEMKGEIITQWGKLTEDEVDKTDGNVTSIVGLIIQKYGHAKEEVEAKIASITEKFKDDLKK